MWPKITIKKPLKIKITKPTSESVWIRGKTYTIEWESSENINNIGIGLIIDDLPLNQIPFNLCDSMDNLGKFKFNLIYQLLPGKYRVIIWGNGINVESTSEAFELKEDERGGIGENGESITIIRPNSNDVIQYEEKTTIRWTSTGEIKNVNIDLLDRRGYEKICIARNIPNKGHYEFITEYSFTDNRIKITSVENPNIYGYSEYFTIGLNFSLAEYKRWSSGDMSKDEYERFKERLS